MTNTEMDDIWSAAILYKSNTVKNIYIFESSHSQ